MQTPQPRTQESLNRFTNLLKDDKFKKSFGAMKQRRQKKNSFKALNELQTPGERKEVVDKQNFYFRVRVISKVGVFIQKLKSFVTLSQPNFKYQEMEYIENHHEKQNNDRFLFSPYNKLILTFQIVVFVLSIVSAWNASFGVVFSEKNLVPFEIRLASIIVFAVEILVNFNLKVPPDLNQEKMMQDRASVIKNNLKNKLPYDAISLVALIIIQLLDQSTFIIIIVRCLVVMRLRSAFSFIDNIRKMFVETANQQTYANLTVLMIQIFMIVHFLSLFLNGMAIIQNYYGLQKTWITQSGVYSNSQLQLYLYAWYWGANLLTTVGLGDIIPVSFVEILCTAVFGFLMSYIGGMLKVLGQATEVYEKDMRKLNKHLQKVNISHSLKTEIRKQFSYTKQITKIQDPEVEQKILLQLPANMINEMKAGNNTHILKSSIFFKRYTQDILTQLAMRLKRVIYSPNENVFFKGETQTKIWIIEKGSMKQLFNKQQHNQGKLIAEYTPQSSHPGYINFMTDQHFTTYGKSQGFTWTYELKRQSMIEVLKLYPVQYYKFCQTKDKMIMQGKKYISSCFACRKLSHNTIQCPKIHFKPQLQVYRLPRVIKKQRCQRHFYKRSDQKHNSRVIYAIIVQQLMIDKGTSNNYIPSSRGMNNQSDHIKRRNGRVSITSDYLKNIQQIHSMSKKQEMTFDQDQTISHPVKINVTTDIGLFKLNEHYFPHNSASSVLQKYRSIKVKK